MIWWSFCSLLFLLTLTIHDFSPHIVSDIFIVNTCSLEFYPCNFLEVYFQIALLPIKFTSLSA